jgi:hypothetical protein
MAMPTAPEPVLRALAEYAREAEAQRPARLGQLEGQEPGQLLALAELLRARCREGITRLLGVTMDTPDLAAAPMVDRLDTGHFAMLLQTEDMEAVLALFVCHLDLSAVEQEIDRRAGVAASAAPSGSPAADRDALRGCGAGSSPRRMGCSGIRSSATGSPRRSSPGMPR